MSIVSHNRLLLVSTHFPPDRSAGTHRVLRLANDLQNNGWAISILTLDPASYRPSIPVDDALVGRADPGLTVFRTGAFRGLRALVRWRSQILRKGASTFAKGRQRTQQDDRVGWKARRRRLMGSLFAFPDDEIGWLTHAVLCGQRIVRRQRIDVVLSSGPPFTCHLIGHALKSLCRVPWVADFRDPWARAPWGKHGSARAHSWLEARVIKRADAVVLNTPELHREFADWYGPEVARKFHTIANGYDADILDPYAKARPATPPPVILTHAGNLYGVRDPLPLLNALAKCLNDGRVPRNGLRLKLVGKTPAFDIDAEIARLGLGDVVTRMPPVPHVQSLEILAASHVLVVIQPGTALQVPAKLYEYVGLRRVILALADEGAVSRIVRHGAFGFVVSPDDTNAIATVLANLYDNRRTLLETSMENSFADDFDARRQSEKLRRLLSAFVPPTATQLSPSLGDSSTSA